MAHKNSGNCESCRKLISTFPNFHPILNDWFWGLQKKNPEIHVSSAGRGELEQNAIFSSGKSKAKWGYSAHNYNMALDLFQLTQNNEARFEAEWYKSQIEKELLPALLWYGDEGPNDLLDYTHVEIRDWKHFTNQYKLVE